MFRDTTCITLLDDHIHPLRGATEHWPALVLSSYKLETTLDLGVLVLVARCEASLEKAWTASLPQARYDSTTRGMHVHPSSEHLASLAECFLSSAATAADPVVKPASERRDGFSGEITERSKAVGLPQSQFDLEKLIILHQSCKINKITINNVQYIE